MSASLAFRRDRPPPGAGLFERCESPGSGRLTLRGREIAVRRALGAGRLRLLRQFMTESLLLSGAGGAAGLALAWWGTRYVMVLARTRFPRAQEIGIDWRVFLFLFSISI